jgi:TP901 family phage tail tape measure protein
MALERIGLGGVLTFTTDQAERSIKRVSTVFGQFKNKISEVSNSVGKIGGGISSLSSSMVAAGASMLPLTAAVGAGTAQAASFEQQMSAVGAVSNASAADMQLLTSEARNMGVVSAFSATQAAQAMENLSRAGASTTEVVSSLSGVMDTAAAEGLDLATASDIVAKTTRIMGREFSQAANTGDILVRASQLSNTNVTQLGEALTYGGQAARAAGLSLEETTGIFAKLADAGLRGSTGGTALGNALNKLSNPSDKARKLLKELNITMARTEDGGIDLANISQQVSDAISGIEDPLIRTRIATEIFGMRGRRAYEALAAAGEESTNSLINSLRRASEGEGAAAEAAEKRLDNLKGSITLFMSAMEGVSITLFGSILSPMKNIIKGITTNINNITTGVKSIIEAGSDLKARLNAISASTEKAGSSATSMILGIVDAIQDLKDGIEFVRKSIRSVFSIFTDAGPDTIRLITRIGLLLGVASAALGPLLLGIGGAIALLVSVGGPALAGISAIISGLAGLFWPITIAVGALILAFTLIRNEGESIGETFTRIWQIIKDKAIDLWENGIKPIYGGIRDFLIPAIQEIEPIWKDTVKQIKVLIGEISTLFKENAMDSKMTWREVGQVIGTVIGVILVTIARVVRGVTLLTVTIMRVAVAISRAITAVIRVIIRVIDDTSIAVETLIMGMLNNFSEMTRSASNLFNGLYEAISMIWSGNTMGGLRRFGKAILDFLLEPVRAVGRAFVSIIDALGAGETIPSSAREWLRANENIGQRNRHDETTGIRGTAHLGIGAAEREERAARAERTRSRIDAEVAEDKIEDREWADMLSEIDSPEIPSMAEQISSAEADAVRRDRVAAQQAATPPPPSVSPGGGTNIESSICIDGHELAIARQRHDMEVGERAGFKATPWQRRIRVEQGVMTTTGR